MRGFRFMLPLELRGIAASSFNLEAIFMAAMFQK